MTECELLLANCLNAPADDTARLVYADHLREQDSPLGRFIWAGVTLSRFRGNDPVEDGMFFDAQKDLNDTAPGVLAAQLEALLGWQWKHCGWDQEAAAPDRLTVSSMARGRDLRAANQMAINITSAVYERGMLSGLRLPLGVFRDVAAEVLGTRPLERVEVLDAPGLSFSVVGPVDEPNAWKLVGELKLSVQRRLTFITAPEQTIAEALGVPTRDGLVRHIVQMIDYTVESLRSQSW